MKIKENSIYQRILFVSLFALVLGMFFTVAEAQPPIDIKIDTNKIKLVVSQQDLTKYADKLEAKLKNKSVGYTFTVITNNNLIVSRAAGDARRFPDKNPRKMTADDKFNIASVSKTITAAAVWKLMNEKRISLDTMIHPYLPSKWKLGPRFNTITFGELLTHRSGIRCEKEVTFTNLRECVAGGIVLTDKNTQKYENTNFALFRFIIPHLNGWDDSSTADNNIGNAIESGTYARLYAEYVQKNIFAPIGLTGIELKPIANNPALAYQFPSPIIAGTSFGDMTETSASQGWNMTSKQLAIFMNGLLNTTKIMPRRLSAKMETAQLGLWKVDIDGKLVNQQHGGGYPGKDKDGKLWNAGEMNTIVMAFPNGISVAIFINSQMVPGLNTADAAREAMKEVWK